MSDDVPPPLVDADAETVPAANDEGDEFKGAIGMDNLVVLEK